eukprot:scaffold67880_cov17-Prasinocladus_malaysianus.AAC.2
MSSATQLMHCYNQICTAPSSFVSEALLRTVHADTGLLGPQVKSLLSAQLAHSRDGSALGLRDRGYDITPLGNRMGLVEWVGETAPVFSLFKNWQARTVEVSSQ